MNTARDRLFGQIVNDRRLVAPQAIKQAYDQACSLQAQGHQVQLGQVLLRNHLLDPVSYQNIEATINQYGRACSRCGQSFLLPPGSPELCGLCRGPLQYFVSLAGLVSEVPTAANSSLISAYPRMPDADSRPSPSSTVTGGTLVQESHDAEDHGKRCGQLSVGGVFANHEILAELGRGGMGVVYKAKNLGNNEIVALKVLLAGEFANKKHKARFVEEIKILEQLNHPGIIPIRDHGEENNRLYYTMRFIDGDSLDRLLKSRKLKMRRGLELIAQVAKAMFEAHELEIVHRDVKPANIMIDDTGNAVLMDFGLAKDLEADHSMTRSGVPLGTPYYMPPEQAQGDHKTIDGRADIYSLGAVLYEIVTGRVPFKADSTNELIRKILEEEPVPPRRLNPRCRVGFEAITLKCLNKDRDQRYASALDLARDLEAALAGRPISVGSGVLVNLQRFLKRKRKAVTIVATLIGILCFVGFLIVERHQTNLDYQKQQKKREQRERLAAEARAKKEKALRDRDKKAKEAQLRKVEEERKRLETKVEVEGLRSGIKNLLLQCARPQNVDVWRQKMQSAKRQSEKLLAFDKTFIQGHDFYVHGQIHEYLGNFQDALDFYLKAGQTPTHSVRGHLAAGTLTWLTRRDRRAAIKLWRQYRLNGTESFAGASEEQEAIIIVRAAIDTFNTDKATLERYKRESILDSLPSSSQLREEKLLRSVILFEAFSNAENTVTGNALLQRALPVKCKLLEAEPFHIYAIVIAAQIELVFLKTLPKAQARTRLKNLLKLVRRAESVNNQLPSVHELVAQMHLYRGDLEGALDAIEMALQLAKAPQIREDLLAKQKIIKQRASVPKFRPPPKKPAEKRYLFTKLVPGYYSIFIKHINYDFDSDIRARAEPLFREFLAYMNSGNLLSAVETLHGILKIAPKHFKTRICLGFCYLMRLQKFEKARKVFDQLLKEQKDHPWVLKFRAFCELRAMQNRQNSDLKLAEKLLLRADQQLQGDFETWELLVNVYRVQEKYKELKALCQQKLQIFPGNFYIRAELNLARLALGEHDLAIKVYKRLWDETRTKSALVDYIFSMTAAAKVTPELIELIELITSISTVSKTFAPVFLDLAKASFYNRNNDKNKARALLAKIRNTEIILPLVRKIIERERQLAFQ